MRLRLPRLVVDDPVTIIDEVGVAVFVSKDCRRVRVVKGHAPNDPREDETPIIRLAVGPGSPGVPLAIYRKRRHLRLGGHR